MNVGIERRPSGEPERTATFLQSGHSNVQDEWPLPAQKPTFAANI